MRRTVLLLAVALLALASVQPAAASDSKLKLFGAVSYVSPLAKTDMDVGGVTDAVKASSEVGFNVGLEVRVAPMLGLELDYLYAKHDLKHDQAGVLGETTLQPISATANFHLPVTNLELYGGPTVSYVNWGDLKAASGGGTTKIDPEVGFGISAGADYNITPQVAITGGLRWLNLQAKAENSTDALDVNPLFTRLGIAAKF